MIYRPPNNDLANFTNNTVDAIRQGNIHCYLLGDYNVDSHQLTSYINDTLFSNRFIPVIARPTKVTTNSTKLIENIFINQLNNNDTDDVIGGILLRGILFFKRSLSYISCNNCGKQSRDVEISLNRRN